MRQSRLILILKILQSKIMLPFYFRVADNDGEFLLIEAADDLPDWAESDSTCLQRVRRL